MFMHARENNIWSEHVFNTLEAENKHYPFSEKNIPQNNLVLWSNILSTIADSFFVLARLSWFEFSS